MGNERRIEIDFTKGFLVIGMVIYHTMNYFMDGRHILYRYVVYVQEAFIFYSGFLCGTIYFSKYILDKNYVIRRLITRAFKLLLLFLFLNIFIHSFFKTNFNGQEFGLGLLFDNLLNNLYDIFILGLSNLTSFEIILPIAYLLVICAISYSSAQYKYLILIMIVLFFVVSSHYDVFLPYNAKCILIGMGGFYTGLISRDIENVTNNQIYKICVISILFIYLLYIAPNPIKLNIIYYYIIINIVIANLHLIGKQLSNSNYLIFIITKFGRYSLLLYLSQIFYLQIVHRITGFKSYSLHYNHFIIIVIITLLLIITYSFIEKIREKSQIFDKFYRIVFA